MFSALSLADISNLARKHGIRLKKSLGQNFLREPGIADQIVMAAELDGSDRVVEIGPGFGSLTLKLAATAGEVWVVELDRRLLPVLEEVTGHCSNVVIRQGDILKTNLDEMLAASKPYKVVANLPYYITTPIIMRLLEAEQGWSVAVVMVQKEVAERITAAPGGKDYGVLSLGVQYRAEAEIITVVPATAFVPQPEVQSAVIRLRRRQQPPVEVTDEGNLFRIIRAAFGQRRKTLLNALSSNLGLPRETASQFLAAVQIDPQRRGETLSLEEYARLANQMALR